MLNQAIIWPNDDLSSVKFYGIHLRHFHYKKPLEINQQIKLQIYICLMILERSYTKATGAPSQYKYRLSWFRIPLKI